MEAAVSYDTAKKRIAFKCMCEDTSPDSDYGPCRLYFSSKSTLRRHMRDNHAGNWLGFEGFAVSFCSVSDPITEF